MRIADNKPRIIKVFICYFQTMKKERKLKEAADCITINSWQVLLDGVTDITEFPMINYIGFTHEWSCFLRPHPFELRSEWTCIIPEQDWDRVFYRVYWRNREVAYCDTMQEAEMILENCEQMQREADHSKDCGAFGCDILEWLE